MTKSGYDATVDQHAAARPRTLVWEHTFGQLLITFACAQQEMIPFAVVGSDQEYQVNGKRILGRKTKWGTIEGK